MSEEQTPPQTLLKMSEAECSDMDFPEIEDEERWLLEVLGMKPRPPSTLDDDTEKKDNDESLGHDESFLQDTQEKKVSSTDESDTCQAECTEEDDDSSHSDSDIEDNVKVIIGNIKTNQSLYMEMLANLKSKAERDAEITTPDNGMNSTD